MNGCGRYMQAIGNHEANFPGSNSFFQTPDRCRCRKVHTFTAQLPQPLTAAPESAGYRTLCDSLEAVARASSWLAAWIPPPCVHSLQRGHFARFSLGSGRYYSFDMGSVHVAVLSTEHDFRCGIQFRFK